MTIEEHLAAICDALIVDVDGLKRAGNDTKDQCSYTRSGYINALFNGDMSVVEMMNLIVKAAHEPLWRVFGYYSDEHGTKHSLGEPQLVRGPDPDYADKAVYDRLFDERLRTAGCGWVVDVESADDYDDKHFEDANGTVRRV